MRVLITGITGQLGWEMRRNVPSGFEAYGYGSAELDIRDRAKVLACVNELRPQVIVNAAAYTAVDLSEDEQELAFAVNALGAENLALAAKAIDSRLIQISTDFVFDGEKSSPYLPTDTPNPLGVYGASKLAGERRVLEILGDRAVVLRTAWVYSAHGRNFVKTMLEVMNKRESVRVVADQIGTPTWAASLAEAVWRMVAGDLAGIYHFTDSGVASWYDLAVAVQEEALAMGILSREIPILPIRTKDYPTRARRPSCSVLDKTSTWESLGFVPAHWRVNLRKMLQNVMEMHCE